jgi:hypothetical protein
MLLLMDAPLVSNARMAFALQAKLVSTAPAAPLTKVWSLTPLAVKSLKLKQR